jgi:hypothetical protein
MDEDFCRERGGIVFQCPNGERFQIAVCGDNEMPDLRGESARDSGSTGRGTTVLQTAFPGEFEGAGFLLGKFAPATGFDILSREEGGGLAEIEIGFDEQVPHSKEFPGVVVCPRPLAFDGIDRKNPAEGGERQIEKQPRPDELCHRGRSDGEFRRGKAGRGKEKIRRDDVGGEDGGVEFRGVDGETFAETTSCIPGRDDDEMIGKIERSRAFPVAGEDGDAGGEDGPVPSRELSTDRRRRGSRGKEWQLGLFFPV